MWSRGAVRRGQCVDVRAKYRRSTIGLALLVLLCGCGGPRDNYDRLPISGTVKLDGQPLAEGYLIFEPKSGQPTQSGGMIYRGKFDVPAESGPVVGTYSVAIFSGAEASSVNVTPGTPEAELAAKKVPGERVPRKYNIDTTLTVDVKPGEKNTYDFDLSTK
jgi:hypothetical protein